MRSIESAKINYSMTEQITDENGFTVPGNRKAAE